MIVLPNVRLTWNLFKVDNELRVLGVRSTGRADDEIVTTGPRKGTVMGGREGGIKDITKTIFAH